MIRRKGRRRLGDGIRFFWLLALVFSVQTGCRDHAPSTPRLVLLYAPCTVAMRSLSPWNPSVTFTPNLAAFAAKSTVFDRHQTESGQLGIAYASLLSGSQADHHRVYRHPATLSDDLYLAAEAYADAGYETFFWNGHLLTRGKLNYAQGVGPENHFRKGLIADDPQFIEILERLSRDPEYKAFVMTNFSVTHGPYRTTHVDQFMQDYPNQAMGLSRAEVEKYGPLYRENHFALTWNHSKTLERLKVGDDLPKLARVIELLYRANINHLDRLFGAVQHAIAARDLTDESLIVFTADHGEVLYRESATFKWTHSMLLDHEVLGVPLLIYSPRLPWSAAPHTGVTRSIDVYPTMAGLSNIELPTDRGIRGVDLSRSLVDGRPIDDLRAYSHTTVLVNGVFRQMYQKQHQRDWLEARRFFPDESIDHIWVGLRERDDWFKHRKLEDGSWVTQLFDLAADPEAEHDIFDAKDDHHAAARDDLLEYKAMLVRAYAAQTPGQTLPEQQQDELLRGLGYIQ